MNPIDPFAVERIVRAIRASPMRIACVCDAAVQRLVGDELLASITSHLHDCPNASDPRLHAMNALHRLADTTRDARAHVGLACCLSSPRSVSRETVQFNVVTQSIKSTRWASLEVATRAATRAATQATLTGLLLHEVAHACDVGHSFTLAAEVVDAVSTHEVVAPESWRHLRSGEQRACWHSSAPHPESRQRRALFPGAFNPVHDGHRAMATVAAEILARRVDFELSVCNVDKASIDYIAVRRRIDQFSRHEQLWLTNAATFLEKATLFPQATFIVGADTIVRVADPRYYGNRRTDRDRAISDLADLQCRFLVFGRFQRGRFETLGDLALPAPLISLCDEVPAERFRVDVSSTAIRRRLK